MAVSELVARVRARVAAARRDGDPAAVLDAVDAALDAVRQLADRVSPVGDDLAELCAVEGALWHDRYALGGAAADLDRAVEAGRRGVRSTTDVRRRGDRLTSLMTALATRYESGRSAADLTELVDTAELAADHPGLDDRRRRPAARTAAEALRERSTRTGDLADLRRAVARHEQCGTLTPTTDPEHALYISALTEARYALVERTAPTARSEPTSGQRPALTLRMVDPTADGWTWELSTGGEPVATRRVTFRGGPWSELFEDLSGYLSRYAVPELDPQHLRDMLRPVGQWVTRELLGPELAGQLADRLPATLTVRLDPAWHRLLGSPLELAVVDGRSLAERGTSVVYGVDGAASGPSGSPLRVLAVFPLPNDTAPLGLRAERLAVEDVVRRAVAAGQPVELTCLQYGVTRHTLRRVVAGGDWDVVHVAGHGQHSGLLLEDEAGGSDPVSSDDLVELLSPLAGRTALVVLGCCSSGANRAARLLGQLEGAPARTTGDGDPAAPERAHGLAARLTAALGASVVAMRFAVDDDAARDYAIGLYEGLLLDGLSVDQASLRSVTGVRGGAGNGALAVLAPVTPVLYAPGTPPGVLLPAVSPEHPVPPASAAGSLFVGRTALLARMWALLGPAGDAPALALVGPPGIGKTACAREFAATAGRAFDRVVPLDLTESPTPAEAARALLAGLGRPDGDWAAVRAVLAGGRILVVVDPLDGVLGEDAAVPPEWREALAALVDHGGASRVLFTARRTVDALPAGCVSVPVGVLSGTEATALFAALPNLGRMLRASRAVPPGTAPELLLTVSRVLVTTNGHPGLLRTFDTFGTDLVRLHDAYADFTRLATGTGPPVPGPRWRRVVAGGRWARASLARLTADQRVLLLLLATLPHYAQHLLDEHWPGWWRRHGGSGDPPPTGPLLQQLSDTLLMVTGPTGTDGFHRVDPIVAAQLAETPPDRTAVADVHAAVADLHLLLWWRAATDPPDGGPVSTVAAANAALWAATALAEAGRLDEAAHVLVAQLDLDPPMDLVRTLAVGGRGLYHRATEPRTRATAALAYGLALARYSPDAGHRHLTTLYELYRSDHPDVAARAGVGMLGLQLDLGRTEAFSPLADQVAQLVPDGGDLRAGLALQLRYERLRHLLLCDEPESALAGAEALLAEYDTPTPAADPPPGPAAATPAEATARMVRHLAVDRALTSAILACGMLGRPEDQLRYAEQLWMERARRRDTPESLAEAMLHKANALGQLGRFAEARRFLDRCQREFSRHPGFEHLTIAVTLRVALDVQDGQSTDLESLHRQLLALRYRIGDALVMLASAHLALYGAMVTRLSTQDDAGTDEKEPSSAALAGHLLAAVAALWVAGQRTAARRALDEWDIVLADLREEDPSQRWDFAWIDRTLAEELGWAAPLAERLRQHSGDRLAEAEESFLGLIDTMFEADRARQEERQDRIRAAREELAPVFEVILAAAQGDPDARAELEEACQRWAQDEATRPWAEAFRALANGCDLETLIDLVAVDGVTILAPLLRDLAALNHIHLP
ncbi:AAA ATPase domain-containing protein [Micromonospora pallida]|uniref:AAA ATPase domain-containing protein n=1 Tax=Micromonospora pallida TaxID=145854 RepID=A0A1C6RYC9_9ACTN|nr:CHAT domain-containing protein [Micromonospora pallida]SCL22084.1 AAA ATPase domain-containing protein [Micromonospora pallida]